MLSDSSTKIKAKKETLDNFSIFSLDEECTQQKRSEYGQSDIHQSESWVVPKINNRPSHNSSHFRMIVCGDSGIGKSSLVYALTDTTMKKNNHTSLEPVKVFNNSMDLCVVDTCGYGALLRAENVFFSVKSYLESQFQKTNQLFNPQFNDTQQLEFILNQSSDCLSHVDCCLYLIMGRIKPVDIEYMRTIHDLVNIIPVIIQPDLALRPEFIMEQRLDLLDMLSTNQIKFNYLGYDTFDDLQQACKQPNQHPYCPPFMLDWSSTKRTFHGLLPLKKALYQHATNSIYLKQDTARHFIQWRSNTTSPSASMTSFSSCSESIQQNIRISQYASERRHGIEKELLRLQKEFDVSSKQKRTELILKEINALVMDNKQDILVQNLLHCNNNSQFLWISLSLFLFIIICYQHFWNNNSNSSSNTL